MSSSNPIKNSIQGQGGYYNTNNTLVPTPTGTLTGTGSGTTFYSGISAVSPALNFLAPNRPPVIEVIAANDDVTYTFIEQEGSDMVRAELKPEYDISALDSLKITKLIGACMLTASGLQFFKPITYIRRHNLERHFTFRVK